ncbi:hypothetical protein P7K49_038004 [Saguinus oedipus]|uniref:MAGE domain-containing protein n=1 Tax=Saguinus oedipus TaxID=9490 RepID=A0ABQ9TDF2_SAGOE|nr:hypothetical protein P7K49_038004 [Saguinus oedipus]
MEETMQTRGCRDPRLRYLLSDAQGRGFWKTGMITSSSVFSLRWGLTTKASVQQKKESQILQSPAAPETTLTSVTNSRSSSGEGASSHREKPGPRASRVPALAEFRPRVLLSSNAAELEVFLLLKNHKKEPTQKAGMLKHIIQQHMHHFPAVLRKASKSLD